MARRHVLANFILMAGAGLGFGRHRAGPSAVWRVRLRVATPFAHSRVIDARAGEDVSNHFPITCARRLRRSLATGQPRRMACFLLTPEGRPQLDGDRVATEPRWVQVVGTT